MPGSQLTGLRAHLTGPTLWEREISDKHPLVSICIPSFNHGEYVEASVRSALAQTYERIEVLVSDDRSDDGSYERLRMFDDSRLHVERNPRRLGHAGNRNRVVARARGELIKFLDDDDLLDPECVSEMVEAFAEAPTVAMAFCRRRIAVEGQLDDVRRGWLNVNTDLQRGLVGVERLNDGRRLFEMLLDRDFRLNLIGEPSTVMVSASHLRRVGLFSTRVHQLMDLDLWARLLPHGMAAFLSQERAVYRIGHGNATNRNNSSRRTWLDRLWLLENLSQDDEVLHCYPKVAQLLRVERRQAWRAFVQFGKGADHTRVPARLYVPYAKHRMHTLARRRCGSPQIVEG
jgi:glycosyltransferase involved in cell wall biosynthesis